MFLVLSIPAMHGLLRWNACQWRQQVLVLQVDGALLAHGNVAEAVAFGQPDELMGEVVSAVVVLRDASGQQDHAADIRRFLVERLTSDKVSV